MNVEVFSVEEDGLPDMEDDSNIGRIAFIWDGCVVSGWPIRREILVENQSNLDLDVQWWEPSEDRFGRPVTGVEYWLLLPVPAWSIDKES